MLLKYPVSSWSILKTSVLNCVSDRLAISSSLGCIFIRALNCSFSWAFLLLLLLLSQCACYLVRGRALGVHQAGATHVAMLWCCMWGRGLRGNSDACSTLCQFSVTSPTSHSQIGPFWCWFLVSGFVYVLGPCGSLQLTLLWGWEFLLLPPQPLQVFSVRSFEALFPQCWNPGLHGLSCYPVVPPGLSAQKCGNS